MDRKNGEWKAYRESTYSNSYSNKNTSSSTKSTKLSEDPERLKQVCAKHGLDFDPPKANTDPAKMKDTGIQGWKWI